jgi:hypothetical protein
MFHYYGSKNKIAKYYPKPKYNLIIEPFAGTASYSLLYYTNEVLLNDKYEKIFSIWNWLINSADKNFIMENSNFFVRQDISVMDFPEPYKNLVGFCINRGSIAPKNIVQKWSCQVKSNPEWASTTYYKLNKIAESLDTIRHWKIQNLDYKDLDNIEATWFIDPPYQVGGNLYVENHINYEELREFCLTRKGQVIVCENSKANWLDFKPLVEITGQSKKSLEMIWTNE